MVTRMGWMQRVVMGRGGKARRLVDSVGAIWRGMTLAQAMEHVAAVRGRERAVTLETPLALSGFEMRAWTYQDVARFIEQASAKLFTHARVRPGERVAICTSNGIDQPLMTLAAVRCGAVAVPLNHQLRAEEVRFIVEDSGARTLVVDPAVLRDALSSWVSSGELPAGLEQLVLSGHLHEVPGLVDSGLPVVSLWDLLCEEETAQAAYPASPDAVCAIFYTSGTTGFPKGAMLTSRSILSDLRFLLGLPTLWPQSVLLALPMAHIMGFVSLLLSWLAGMPVVFLSRFDVARVLDWLESGEVDAFFGVPSMYQLLWEGGAGERDLRGVKVFGSAADVMPASLMERFKSAGRLLSVGPLSVPAAFVEAYGSVELSGAAMVRVSAPWWSASEGGFVGVPLPGYKVRVVSEEGHALGPGEVGELQVQGQGVLQGYLGRAEATAETIDAEGWLRTGDLASRTRLGTVRFVGREKDVIKSGGYSIYPAEVEAQLLQHPSVVKAAVVGLPDRRKRAVPVAVVCVRPGEEVDVEALKTWVGARVARYKVPRQVHIIGEQEMPYGSTGKILKRRLIDRFLG